MQSSNPIKKIDENVVVSVLAKFSFCTVTVVRAKAITKRHEDNNLSNRSQSEVKKLNKKKKKGKSV